MASQIVQPQINSSYPAKVTMPMDKAPIETLPAELLRLGAEALAQLSHPYDDIQHDLISCLLTSHKLHESAIPLVYRNVKFSKVSTFEKFLGQLTKYPSLGNHVQRLDLSELSGDQIPAAETLNRCLSLTPMLRGFLAPSELQIDQGVLEILLCDLPRLQVLDLQGCNSTSFTEAFISLFGDAEVRISTSITELNLHGCSDLPYNIFEYVLPQLPKLRILDVSQTKITDEALSKLCTDARLTDLNISCCALLSGREVARILSTHPSFTSLVSLNLETKPVHEDATLSEEDLHRLLPSLPSTLRSLNLKRSNMTPEHTSQLKRLATHLEELRVGTDLRLQDLESIFLSPSSKERKASTNSENATSRPSSPSPIKTDPVLSPMEQAIAVCKLHQRLNTTPALSPPPSTLKFLDISSMSVFQQRKITGSVLLGEHSRPLESIELSEEVYLISRKVLERVCASVNWRVKWDGRRCFVERVQRK